MSTATPESKKRKREETEEEQPVEQKAVETVSTEAESNITTVETAKSETTKTEAKASEDIQPTQTPVVATTVPVGTQQPTYAYVDQQAYMQHHDFQQYAQAYDNSSAASSSQSASGTNLFVNYLPPTIDDDALRNLFSPFGEIVSSKVMVNYQTMQSRGFGFVQFRAPEAAATAIQSLHGFNIQNKYLQVKLADNISQVSSHPSTNVYIKGLPINFTDQQLRSIFQPYGSIVQSIVLVDPVTKIGKGTGMVRYSNDKEAQTAIQALNGKFMIPGASTPLIVKFAMNENEKESRRAKMVTKGITPKPQAHTAMYQPISYVPYPYVVAQPGTASTATPASTQYMMMNGQYYQQVMMPQPTYVVQNTEEPRRKQQKM